MKRNKKFQLLLIFIISFGFFLLLQFSSPGFLCPDTFYHIKCADLIRHQGVIKDFPWLKFTILHNSQYVDHHFLFHLLLVPFLYLGLITGPKIAIALFASLFFSFFLWFLKRYKIRFAFWWTLFLLVCSMPFILRLNLIRAQNLSLIFVILGLYFIFKRKYLALGIVSFFYVWLFDGFILLPFLALIYFLVVHFLEYKPLGLSLFSKAKALHSNAKRSFLVFLSSFSGMILGIIINPYFPKNLYFYYVHIARIGFLNPQSLPVGGEWYPPEFPGFFLSSLFVFLLFGFCLASFIIFYFLEKKWFVSSEKIQVIWALFIACLIVFIRTILSQRFVEYWVPLIILLSAFIFDSWVRQINLKKIIAFFREKKPLFLPSLACLSILFLFFISLNIAEVFQTMKSSSPYDKYKKASDWLIQNTKKGSIIFNVNWDDFPQLFFWNDKNFYIVGLDPTFMYVYDRNLWDKYRNIKENLDQSAKIIKEDFRTEYLFLSKKNKELEEELDKREDFEKKYEDEQAKIYKLR